MRAPDAPPPSSPWRVVGLLFAVGAAMVLAGLVAWSLTRLIQRYFAAPALPAPSRTASRAPTSVSALQQHDHRWQVPRLEWMLLILGFCALAGCAALVLEGFQLEARPVQVSPAPALQAQRATQAVRLHASGWVDQASGVVHIPIERAIEVLLESELPARPAAPLPP